MFKVQKMQVILYILFLVSIVNAENIKITKLGIVNKNTQKILNTHINTIPNTYTFYILNDNLKQWGILKEVRLSSSQAQCYAPIHNEGKERYKIYNIYCYDRVVSHSKIKPIFYIYNLKGINLKDFTFLSPDRVTPSYGITKNNKIIFNDVNLYIDNKKQNINNIECIVPGKDFFNSNFEKFQCAIKNLDSAISDLKTNKGFRAVKYYDQGIIDNTLKRIPLTPQTLTQYNDIAYYLQKAGANKEAVYLLKKIVAKFPNRTVAYINLGDAYWALGEKEKAKKAYTTYIEQMCNKGLQKKIPQKVLKRVEKKRCL